MKKYLSLEENPVVDEPAVGSKTVVDHGVLTGVLVAVGFICLIAGVLYMTKITAGVGGIAAACFFGIVARIAQAHAHHKDK